MTHHDRRPPAPGVPATLEAVAAAAGVSRSTVSRVVNGSTQVSPEVVAAVQAAIERLDYVPNRAARSLANRQTMSIALVVPEDTTRFFGDPYLPPSSRASRADWTTATTCSTSSCESFRGRRRRRFATCSAATSTARIVVSHHSGDHFLEPRRQHPGRVRRPAVRRRGRPRATSSTSTTRRRRQKGTQHLIDSGRRRIATIAGPPTCRPASTAPQGWRAHSRMPARAPTWCGTATSRSASGAAPCASLLDAYPDIDAVFVASDPWRRGALACCASAASRCPRMSAVVGFDDSPAATDGDVQLTTVRQPSVEMGIKMAEMMLGILGVSRSSGSRSCRPR